MELKKNKIVIIALVLVAVVIFVGPAIILLDKDKKEGSPCDWEMFETEDGEEIPASKHYFAMGEASFGNKEYDDAVGFFEKSLRLYSKELGCWKDDEKARINGSKAGIMAAYNYLGAIYMAKGQIDNGTRYYKKAIGMANEIGDNESAGDIYYALGAAYNGAHENKLAMGAYNNSLNIKMQNYNKNKEDIAKIYEAMGNCSYSAKRYEEATRYYKKLLEIRKESGNREEVSHVLDLYLRVGRGYMEAGDYFKAQDFYNEVLKLKKEEGFDIKDARLGIADAKYYIGSDHVAGGDYGQAVMYYQESQGIKEDYSDDVDVKRSIGDINFRLGAIFGDMSGTAVIIFYYDDILNESVKVNIPNTSRATLYYDDALDIYWELERMDELDVDDSRRIGEIYFRLGAMYMEDKQYSKANDAFSNALNAYNKLNLSDDQPRISDIYFYIGHCFHSLMDYTSRANAVKYYDKSLEIKNELESEGQDVGGISIARVLENKAYASS